AAPRRGAWVLLTFGQIPPGLRQFLSSTSECLVDVIEFCIGKEQRDAHQIIHIHCGQNINEALAEFFYREVTSIELARQRDQGIHVTGPPVRLAAGSVERQSV